jgi:spore coat protein U-like protein
VIGQSPSGGASNCRHRRSPARAAIAGAVVLAAMTIASRAHAGADCSITSVGMNFGLYDAANPQPDDVAATVTVTCVYVAPGTTGVSYTVALSNGLHGTSATSRRMEGPEGLLGYNVYVDSSRTRIWGTGSGGTVIASGSMTVGPGVGNGTRTATHTVYGRMPALQDALPGQYLDTLMLTLTY